MTTNIKILNDGPHYVKVEVQGRNTKGQFVAAQEHYISPSSFHNFWVGEDQSIQVLEQKIEPVVPATPPSSAQINSIAGTSEGLLHQ